MYPAGAGTAGVDIPSGPLGAARRCQLEDASLRQLPISVLLLLFFGSGATALVYETVWVRQLTLSFGISVHAISAVLAAYMFGLSLGAAWVGRLADRFPHPLRVYAWFEFAIAGYALLVYLLLSRALPELSRLGHGALPDVPIAVNLTRFAAAFALLAVPTTLMGGTLPLLGRFLAASADTAGVQVGRLYGINTLGAVVGTGVAGFWALQHLGIFLTTAMAVLLNIAIACVALWLSLVGAAPPAPTVTSWQTRGPTSDSGELPGARLAYLAIFLSGYSALAYQVMWNRTLLLYVHNSIYAFSMILAVFLLGVAFGSLLYARVLARWTSLRALGACQLALGLYVWLSIWLTGHLPGILGAVTDAIGSDTWGAALAILALAAGLVVFPPTVAMGISLPMAMGIVLRPGDAVGARIGGFYAINTLGNILGALVTGFLLIELVGLRDSFAVAIACNVAAGCLLLSYRADVPRRAAAGLAIAGGLVASFLALVDRDTFRRLYEDKYPEILFYKEEVTDTVMVIGLRDGGRAVVFSDGRGTAGTNTEPYNRIYGHVPMLLHRDPQNILTIGFGVGNTLSALAQHQPERLVVAELSPGVIEAARYFPTNRNVLATPGLEIRIEDGRHHLLTTPDSYDVIQLEPPEIHTSAVVNLYTREFYQLARDHLRPGGIICQWLHAARIPERETRILLRTFVDAFPHASLWNGGNWWDLLMIGSTEPLRATPEELWRRYNRREVRTDLERIGVGSPHALLSHHLLGPEALARYVADVPAISDDWTYVDFSVPRSSEAGFGVFVHQAHLRAPVRLDADRIRRSLRMLAQRESPAYLVAEGKGTERFRTALVQATKARRLESQAALDRMLGRRYKRRGVP